MKKRIIGILVLIILVAGIGVGVLIVNKSNNTKPSTTTTTTSEITNITYKGQDGVTAFVLLQQNAKVLYSGTGENVFVTSINGIASNDAEKMYWTYYINGEMAMVGVNSYITKDSDIITWKYELSKY